MRQKYVLQLPKYNFIVFRDLLKMMIFLFSKKEDSKFMYISNMYNVHVFETVRRVECMYKIQGGD